MKIKKDSEAILDIIGVNVYIYHIYYLHLYNTWYVYFMNNKMHNKSCLLRSLLKIIQQVIPFRKCILHSQMYMRFYFYITISSFHHFDYILSKLIISRCLY